VESTDASRTPIVLVGLDLVGDQLGARDVADRDEGSAGLELLGLAGANRIADGGIGVARVNPATEEPDDLPHL